MEQEQVQSQFPKTDLFLFGTACARSAIHMKAREHQFFWGKRMVCTRCFVFGTLCIIYTIVSLFMQQVQKHTSIKQRPLTSGFCIFAFVLPVQVLELSGLDVLHFLEPKAPNLAQTNATIQS